MVGSAKQRIVGLVRNGHLGGVGFPEDDGSGTFQSPDYGRIVDGKISGQQSRAAGRPDSRSGDRILYRNRHAVEQSQGAAGIKFALSFAGLIQNIRRECNNRIQGRINLLNALKVGFDYFNRGNASRSDQLGQIARGF
jgi:hypothetical protein